MTTSVNLDKLETQAIQHHYQQQKRRDEFLLSYAMRQQQQQQAVTLADEAEHYVATIAKKMGYGVRLTPHTHPYDIEVIDSTGRVARVEVKISTIQPNGSGYRYQARIHHHRADLVVFIARNGSDWPYIIPMAAIKPRLNIAISSKCPGNYSGQWAGYLNAWHYLHTAVKNAPARPVQLGLVQ